MIKCVEKTMHFRKKSINFQSKTALKSQRIISVLTIYFKYQTYEAKQQTSIHDVDK